MEYFEAMFHNRYPKGATMSSDYGEKPAFCRQLTYGLMSLSDMVNLHLSSLCSLCSQLMLEQIAREDGHIRPAPDDPITNSDRERIEGWLKIATHSANEFEWKAVHDRIKIIDKKLKKPMSNRTLATELRVLRETIHSGLEWQLVYRYPQEKNAVLTNWKENWSPVLSKFPSAEADIIAGVDLWALQHHTASAFHFMRVLEHGLRALAQDVGKSFDIQNWQNIIDEIEAEIRQIGKNAPRGSEKSERLRFLSEAAKEFVYFKDGWRNHVAHSRANYDEYQARGILEHVKAFMTALSSKLSENPSERPLS